MSGGSASARSLAPDRPTHDDGSQSDNLVEGTPPLKKLKALRTPSSM
jgi:hypothetical protein